MQFITRRENRPKLVEHGLIIALVHVFRSCKDITVLTNAVGALANVALHTESTQMILDSGAAKTLVQICQSSHDAAVLQYACVHYAI